MLFRKKYFINCKKALIYTLTPSTQKRSEVAYRDTDKKLELLFIYGGRFCFPMRKGQAGYVGGRYKSFQVRLSCADTVNKSQKHTRLQILATLSIYTDILSFDPQASEVVKPPFHPSCPKVEKQQEHPLMHMGPFHAEPR